MIALNRYVAWSMLLTCLACVEASYDAAGQPCTETEGCSVGQVCTPQGRCVAPGPNWQGDPPKQAYDGGVGDTPAPAADVGHADASLDAGVRPDAEPPETGAEDAGTADVDAPADAGPQPPEGENCGNARLDEGEQCDDGNSADSDGCSSSCLNECQYFDFDGIDDYLTWDGDDQTGARTFEVWTQGVRNCEHVRASTQSMALSISNCEGITLQAFTEGSGTGDSTLFEPTLPGSLDLSGPVHFAAVFNGTDTIHFFVNGRLVRSGGRRHNQTTENYACAGATRLNRSGNNTTTSYRSRIRSLRFSSGQTYEDEFTPADFSVTEQTLLLYRAQDHNNGTVPDLSDRHEDAALRGGTAVRWGACR